MQSSENRVEEWSLSRDVMYTSAPDMDAVLPQKVTAVKMGVRDVI